MTDDAADGDTILKERTFRNLPANAELHVTTECQETDVIVSGTCDRPNQNTEELSLGRNDTVVVKLGNDPKAIVRVTMAFTGEATVKVTAKIIQDGGIQLGETWSHDFTGHNGDVHRAKFSTR